MKKAKKKGKALEEEECCFSMTTQPLMPELILERYAEMIFEDFKFNACFMGSSASMALKHNQKEFQSDVCLVIDSGFSFTYAIPFIQGHPLRYAAKRIDVGGKLLTNLLTEMVSYKEVNLTGETLLVNDIKEQLCYVSLDYESDLDQLTHFKQSPLIKEYVLPDYNKHFKGYVKDPLKELAHDEQTIKMANSRINVPEVLFNPSDIGIDQSGLPEMIMQCV